MPEARDRLSRANDDDDFAETYSRRQASIRSIGVLRDGERSIYHTPFRWGSTPLTGDSSSQRTGAALSGSTSTRGGRSGRGLFGSPMTTSGSRGYRSQNTPPSGGGFRRSPLNVLPSWYPRTPLRDITHVVRAIERRRVRLGEGEGQTMGSPAPILVYQQPAGQDLSQLGAQLEHKASSESKTCKQSATLGKVPLIIRAIANQDEGDSEQLTPQKRLLNSIDIVEKVVMEELNRLKRTPAAKRAEREKKVRTLMSMR